MFCALVALAAEPEPPHVPGTESVRVRLVQIDVQVDEEKLAGHVLTPADLELIVDHKAIENFLVDRMCGDTVATTAASAPAVTQEPKSGGEPAAERLHPTIVFFFDQSHLTSMGRERGIEIARELIDRLVTGGAKASIVSSATTMKMVVSPTDDRDKLHAGLDAMRKDPRAFDSYAMTEDFRYDTLVRQATDPTQSETAKSLARSYQREEYWEYRRTKDRLVVALDAMAEATPPKALVYVGDTLRMDAGEWYLHMVGLPGDMIPASRNEFDQVINAAIARGVHVYTIEARGLISDDSERLSAAQNTFVSLAAETGGQAFLGASGAERDAALIGARIGCPYIISFPPGNLPRDRPLPVELTSKIPGVRVTAQGRLVILGDSALLTSRIRSAFNDPDAQDDGRLHVGLVPRSLEGKIWHADVLVRLETDVVHKIGVELGATVMQGDALLEQASTAIATQGKPSPLVLKRSVSFPAGAVKVVGVAHDPQADDVTSKSLEADWPNPKKASAVIAPIAVMQPRVAAFSADDSRAATRGVALDEDEAIDPAKTVALESVVCRGVDVKGELIIDRRLEGNARGDYPVMKLAAGERCQRTLDVIEPNGATGIVVDYRIIVRSGNEILAEQRRPMRFAAAKAEAP